MKLRFWPRLSLLVNVCFIIFIFLQTQLPENIHFFSYKDNCLRAPTFEKNAISDVRPPLSTVIELKDSKNNIFIEIQQKEIWVQPFETPTDEHPFFYGLRISSKDYPYLFSQGVANASFVFAQLIHKDNKGYIKISNNQPDHGGYSEVASIYINIDTQEISTELP